MGKNELHVLDVLLKKHSVTLNDYINNGNLEKGIPCITIICEPGP